MKLEIKYLLVLYFLGFSALGEGSSSAARPGYDLARCLYSLGSHIYQLEESSVASGSNGSKTFALPGIPHCLMDDAEEEIRAVVREAIRGHGEDIGDLSSEDRAICTERWVAEWAETARSVWDRTDWSDVPYVHVRHPYEELPQLEQILFARAEIEREMVLRNQARAKSDRAEAPACRLMWINSLLAREDNLAFFRAQRLLEKFAAGDLSSKVFAEFWLVIQHADMHPEFQAQALGIIERFGPEQNFPDVLVRSLRSRVEMQRQHRAEDH